MNAIADRSSVGGWRLVLAFVFLPLTLLGVCWRILTWDGR